LGTRALRSAQSPVLRRRVLPQQACSKLRFEATVGSAVGQQGALRDRAMQGTGTFAIAESGRSAPSHLAKALKGSIALWGAQKSAFLCLRHCCLPNRTLLTSYNCVAKNGHNLINILRIY